MLNKKIIMLALLVTLLMPVKNTFAPCWWSILYPQAQSTVTSTNAKPVVKFKLIELFSNQ